MTALRPAHDRALTLAEREFLEQLRFRNDPQHPSFIFSLDRGRQGVIVRTMFGTYETHPRFTKNQRTLDGLEREGLITIGQIQKLPHPFGPGGAGKPIAITASGRNAIG